MRLRRKRSSAFEVNHDVKKSRLDEDLMPSYDIFDVTLLQSALGKHMNETLGKKVYHSTWVEVGTLFISTRKKMRSVIE